MDKEIHVQNLDKAVCIPHSTNTFRKSMNPTILLLVMDKIVGQVYNWFEFKVFFF